MAAQRSAAASDAPEHLCLVSDSYLAQFNAHPEHSRQIFYQFSEINSAVSGKVKYDLAVVKSVLHVYELHNKSVFIYLFLAKFHGPLFLFEIFLMLLMILFSCHAYDFFKGSHDFSLVHFSYIHGDRTELHASGGFHYDAVVFLYLQLSRIKIIYLTRGLKSHSRYFYHVILRFLKSNFLWRTDNSLSAKDHVSPLQ